jgi:hypothetical protein
MRLLLGLCVYSRDLLFASRTRPSCRDLMNDEQNSTNNPEKSMPSAPVSYNSNPGVPTAHPLGTPSGGAECTTLEGLHDSARLARLSIQSYTICERIQRPRPSLLYRYKNSYWQACSPVPAGTTVQIALTILSRGNHTRILHLLVDEKETGRQKPS